MDLITILAGLAFLALITAGYASGVITKRLKAEDIEVDPKDFTRLRRNIRTHLRKYREITQKDTGETGKAFYVYIVSIASVIVLVIAGILTRFL